MPWTAAEATSHTKKADTPAKRAKWAKIANAALKQYKNEGKAVRIANAAMGSDDAWNEDRHRRKTIVRNRRGDIKETREEEEDATHDISLVSEIFTPPVVANDSVPALMFDAVELDDAAKVTLIDGGYLKAMPRIARTGIQLYKGDECGRPDMESVRVYRPQDAVFGADAVHSYTHLPITLEHPGVAVDSANWRKHAIGETGDEVLRDGNSVRVPMMIRDAKAIAIIKDGKNQLSVGYACDLQWGDGITPDGEKYDATQTNIRGNHLAVVKTARGGPTLKIGDTDMDMKTLLVDGIQCQMSDISAAVVQKTIAGLQDQIENFKKKKKEEEDSLDEALKEVESKDAAIKVKDAEIVELNKKLTDAIDPKLVRDGAIKLLGVIEKAQKVTGKTVKMDSVSDAIGICREVVNAKLGDVAKGWDDNKIEAAFDAITVTASTGTGGNTIRDAVSVFAGRPGPGFQFQPQSLDARDQAYYDSVKADEDAWKKKPVQ